MSTIARLIDEVAADEADHLLVHLVEDDGPDLTLGTRALDRAIHPFTVLAGFTAPASWCAIGLRVHGQAHHLGSPVEEAIETSTTFLLDRTGRHASLLRRAERVCELEGPAEGTVVDLCHRALGLPTAPPPEPTPDRLWMTLWLDAILTTWSDPARRRELCSSWHHVAALHPAMQPTQDPDRLVTIASAHARSWSWARLRAEAPPLPLPGGDLPGWITRWMDDGFYARWMLGALPDLGEVAHDLLSLLEEPLRARLRQAIFELVDPVLAAEARW